MKALLVTALLALSFTTGFTCSKNAPEAAAPTEATQPTAEATPAAPAEGTAAPTEGAAATAAPTEAAPAAPATETK
ncbi:MAG: acylneuraminate cytidylyltransferase [Pseudobdellovibrio sp.]|nr:acylneuraminate cytidylyltransferase [Pseudobdellovibrio sp.]